VCVMRVRFVGVAEADEYLVPHQAMGAAEAFVQNYAELQFNGSPVVLDLWAPEQLPVLLNSAALASLSLERCDEYLKNLIEQSKNS